MGVAVAVGGADGDTVGDAAGVSVWVGVRVWVTVSAGDAATLMAIAVALGATGVVLTAGRLDGVTEDVATTFAFGVFAVVTQPAVSSPASKTATRMPPTRMKRNATRNV